MNTKKALVLVSLLVILGLTGLRPANSRTTDHLNSVTEAGNRAVTQISIPKITKATIEKKDLIVEGESFAAGANVLLNGTKTLKARNDEVTPGAKVIVKKGRNSLPEDEVVSLQVKNPDGLVSEAIGFFTGLTLTYHNTQNGVSIFLRVGQIVLLNFDDSDIFWQVHDSGGHGDAIEFISSKVPLMPKAQELFLTQKIGHAFFRIDGVHSSDPPFFWLVNLEVQ